MTGLRQTVATTLCFVLAAPATPGWSQAAPTNTPPEHAKGRPAYQSTQLKGDDRIMHAMNRFTFGPRPADVDVIRAIGLDKWFEQQLHPQSLDLTDLDARLAEYPAMQWNTADLLF